MYRPSWICCYMKIGWFVILGPHPNIYCFAWQMSTFYSPLWVDYNYIIPNLSMIMCFLCYFCIENGQCINLDDSFWLFNSIHAQWSLQSLTGKSVRQSQKKNVKVAPCRFSDQRISTGNPWFSIIHNKPAKVLLKCFDTASNMTLLVASICGL